jgi:hypothetical protein
MDTVCENSLASLLNGGPELLWRAAFHRKNTYISSNWGSRDFLSPLLSIRIRRMVRGDSSATIGDLSIIISARR